MLELDAEEARVVGALIEKAATVPDSYPMTLNSLRSACNQSTARDPVVAYDEGLIARCLDRLKEKGVVRFVHASHGARTTKFRHVLDEVLRLDPAELAVVGLLLLRGPQSAGELRTRTERQHRFESTDEVEAALRALADREVPLVHCIGRRSGQREDRWQQLLAPEPDAGPGGAGGGDVLPGADVARAPDTDADLHARIDALEARVADLEQLLADL